MSDPNAKGSANVPAKPEDVQRAGSPEYYESLRQAAVLPVDQYPDGYIRTILKMAVPSDASFSEAAGFLSVCKQYGLNPILGQAFLAKMDDGGVKVVTGRDTFITLAERQAGFRGIAQGVVYKGEKCIISRNPKDPFEVWIEHEQSFDERQQSDIVGAYCVVYDESRPPLIIRRFWKDYEYLWSNVKKRNWRRNGTDMIENRAIAAALRRMYSLAGLIIAGEEDGMGPQPAIRHEQAGTDDLRARIEQMEEKAGLDVQESWSPEVVIVSGKHEGKRWMDLAAEDPKYVRQVANRRWLGITAQDAKEMLAWLDAQEAPGSPESDEEAEEAPVEVGEAPEEPEDGSQALLGQDEGTPPTLKELHVRARKAGLALLDKSNDLLTDMEGEEIELLYHDENYEGLRDLVDTLERRLQGGEVS